MTTESGITIIQATESKNGVRSVISNRRVSTGHVATLAGGHIPFESTLERDFLYLADFNSRVSSITAQPLKLTYRQGSGESRSYTPDFLLLFRPIGNDVAWSPCLYEVKYQEELKDRWEELRPRFRAATAYCRQRGWRFRITTDRFIRTPFLKNVTFLRYYRNWPTPEGQGLMLLEAMKTLQQSTPSELLAATFWNKDRRMQAVGVLWNLIATRGIGVNLMEPLTMESEIWYSEPGLYE